MLYGRAREQERIANLVEAARDGASAALVVRGDPGIGKSALLDWAAGLSGVTVLRGSGVEFEAELPFAGLSQLLRPAFDRLDQLPEAQRDALKTAFGLGVGAPSDRLLVGLGVLSLLAEASRDTPLLCLVDDAHWLDSVSAQALLFAARRLHADGVVMIFGARDGLFPAPGVPELPLAGLAVDDAARLLPSDLDPSVRYRVLGEAQGNPLALLELPHAMSPTGMTRAVPLTERLLAAFHGQVRQLPPATQTLLLVAAAEDTGDLQVVLRGAGIAGAGPADLHPAEQARLIEVTGARVRFRHPLVRAAVYQEAPYAERLTVHQALADALRTPEVADRRAWHRAAAVTGPDEQVAQALEDTAEQARARSGYGAALVAFERAAELTDDPSDQARRLLRAAESGLHAGVLSGSVRLAERAATLVDDPRTLAEIAWVEAFAWFWQGVPKTAFDLMIAGADLDPDRRTALLMEAFHPAWYLGEPQLGECLDRLESVDHPLARYQVAAVRGRPPALAEVAADLAGDPRDLLKLCGLGFTAGQDAQAHELAAQLVARFRADGSVGLLPMVLFFLAEAQLFHGRHRDAALRVDEALRIAYDVGQPQWVSQLLAVSAVLVAIDGDESRCRELVAQSQLAPSGAAAAGGPWTIWALGLLDLGQGRAEAAVTRLASLQDGPYAHQVCAYRSIPDLVEAAVRAGTPELASAAADRYASWADRVEQPWVRGLAHRCKALLGGDEKHYLIALQLPTRPFERARTELLYGEWLRRARSKAEARIQLHRAVEAFDQLGASPWSARARTELEATGLRVSHVVTVASPLTPQELQIARLAAEGLSNKDIAAQLFLSPKTVAYHLYKAYPKLNIAGRAELAALTL